MSAEELAEMIGRLPLDRRLLVEKLVETLGARDSSAGSRPQRHVLDIRCVSGTGRSSKDINRQIRQERDSWADR